MKYSLKRYNWSVCLSVHVMENLWSRFFCIVVLYVRPSPFISLFEYRKPFLIIWIESPVPCYLRFLVARVLIADEVHFPKICFMANATPDLTPRHVYQALPVGCAHFSPSLNTPTDNRLAGDRFWRVLCVFNWLILFCWFLSKKKKGFSRWAVGMEQRTVAIIVFIKS